MRLNVLKQLIMFKITTMQNVQSTGVLFICPPRRSCWYKTPMLLSNMTMFVSNPRSWVSHPSTWGSISTPLCSSFVHPSFPLPQPTTHSSPLLRPPKSPCPRPLRRGYLACWTEAAMIVMMMAWWYQGMALGKHSSLTCPYWWRRFLHDLLPGNR